MGPGQLSQILRFLRQSVTSESCLYVYYIMQIRITEFRSCACILHCLCSHCLRISNSFIFHGENSDLNFRNHDFISPTFGSHCCRRPVHRVCQSGSSTTPSSVARAFSFKRSPISFSFGLASTIDATRLKVG